VVLGKSKIPVNDAASHNLTLNKLLYILLMFWSQSYKRNFDFLKTFIGLAPVPIRDKQGQPSNGEKIDLTLNKSIKGQREPKMYL